MDVNSSGSALNQGLIGIQRSQSQIQNSAQEIARASATPVAEPRGGDQDAQATATTAPDQSRAPAGDLVEPLINIQVQEQVFNASAEVVRTANENLGRLIDTQA